MTEGQVEGMVFLRMRFRDTLSLSGNNAKLQLFSI